jgi:SAM-dependent methyltransferase
VLGLAGVAAGRRVLEVGAGTGKATALFAQRGAAVLALEPDPAMAAVARRSCAAWPDVEVLEQEFEHWQPAGERFALLASAQAWHWIAPATRYERAYAALAPGGLVAAFWNLPEWPRCELREELDAAYRRVAFTTDAGPMRPAGRIWDVRDDWAHEIEATAGFGEPEVREYRWEHAYDAGEYVALLGTHSDHIRLPERDRRALYAAVTEVIDRHDGAILIPYVSRLCLARRSGRP